MLLISKTYWLGMPFNYKGALPEGTEVRPLHLQAADMRWITGLYYTPATAAKRRPIGVLVMHPRADFSRHYCIPRFVENGISVLGLTTRCLNNDVTAIHEDLILDVAAGVQYLREQGAEKVILVGNSGGGALFSFYQEQAEKAVGQRIATDPAGKPTKLNMATMIPADALIALSAHAGEGQVLLHCIDPAVTDESNPLASDPALDMYNPDNGFAPPPTSSQYSAEFIAAFRAGQRARVARLDAHARALIADARTAEESYKKTKNVLDFAERQAIGRHAAFEPVMTIYRTMANPNYTDLTQDPSARGYGSLFSERPDLMNYQFIGFGRLVTPAAWLSTWSGLSSNADFCRNIASTQIPVLIVNALRDKEIHPADARKMFAAVTSPDKTFLDQDAEHYFEPAFGEQTAPDVERLMTHVVPWVLERFS
ncbi:MAG: alpha/beta hydrolase [Moraxellaceae bacterium]|nr:alpha/beta hydrolase [Moraxellaceae bacterium]